MNNELKINVSSCVINNQQIVGETPVGVGPSPISSSGKTSLDLLVVFCISVASSY